MKTPYSHVHTRGGLMFAARGGQLHSFDLTTGSHLSTWKHPDVQDQKEEATEAQAAEAEVKEDVEMQTPGDEPPAKRQRLDEHGEGKGAEDAAGESKGARKKGKKARDREKGGQSHRAPQVLDKPLVALIRSTEDGKHVVAVSAHDKALWVFEHDGEGRLNQISQRKLPKRPNDMLITSDQTIIVADKFGDVYSLPLLFTPPSPSSAPVAPAKKNPPKAAAKPSATALTVHSKRNRKALDAQLQMYEARAAKGEDAEAGKAEAPTFEMDLLLGHVSMLTALALGESEGRRYILTADRDEHIRVSRFIPQAHVIEGFCLGHEDFVGAMVIPALRPEILVSGGGDSELLVWDWKSGRKVGSANVLSLVKEIAPETAKVAVSCLTTLAYPSEDGEITYVLAICEDIQAILSWQLTKENVLNHPGVIQIPGNPLHLATAPSNGTAPKIIVATDPLDVAQAKSLNIYSLTANEGGLAVDECSFVADDALTAAEPEIASEQVRTWLYTTEQLRKQEYAAPEEEEEVGAEDAQAEIAAEIAEVTGDAAA